MKTLYITPGVSLTSRAGTLSDPIRVRDARDFDDVLRRPGPHRFVLLPGVYETRGAWAFPERDFVSLGQNSELIGQAGSQATTIRLAETFESRVRAGSTTVPAQNMEVLIAGSRTQQSDHVRIEGITLDCECRLPVRGLHIYSSRARVRDVQVIHIWGDWATTEEGFGILVNNSPKADVNGGHVIEDCRVEHCRPGAYMNGIYCGVEDSGPLVELSHVSRCWVTSAIPNAGRRSHAAFAANHRTRFTGCHAEGFDRWFFCDTSDVTDINIDGCTGTFSYCAIDLPGFPTNRNPIRKRSNIRVINSTFHCANPSDNHAILLLAQDTSPTSDVIAVEDILVDSCIVHSAPTQFYTVSIKAAKARRIRIRNTHLPERAKTAEGVFLPTAPDAVQFA